VRGDLFIGFLHNRKKGEIAAGSDKTTLAMAPGARFRAGDRVVVLRLRGARDF